MQTRRITFNQYPLLLRQIDKPPPFLELAGADIIEEDYRFLCVVGARNHTDYGADVTKHLIAGLKGYKIVIVSGLALGIDSIAHESALANDLKTIAVPGSGLSDSVIYPHNHIALAKKIIDTGNTLISPFDNDQPSALWTFPTRNRLMAGISHATLIIEGKQGSGTLLTAKHALEFNRDVMIIPGSIFSETSFGPHLLYKDGAIPITNSDEILYNLGLKDFSPPISPSRSRRETSKAKDIPNRTTRNQSHSDIETSDRLDSMSMFDNATYDNLSSNEKSIIELLKENPKSKTDIIDNLSLTAVKLNILLSQLEMKNIIMNEGAEIRLKRW